MKKSFLLVLCLMLMMAVGCKDGNEPVENDKEQGEVEKVKVQIFQPDDDYMKLISKEVEIDQLNEQALWDELVKINILTEDTKINSFEQKEGLLVMDVNAAFEDYIGTMGTSGESMTLGSLVNTYLTAYHADELKLTVDGETLCSGHAEYDQNFTMYE